LENVEEEEKFCKWVQEKLGATNIESIKKSKSLVMESDDVGYIFSSKFGWTGNMEKLMAAQPLGDNKKQSFMKGKRIFELNFKHPLISRIYELYNSHYKNSEVENLDESIPKEENVVEVLKTIYNFTLLSSDFPIDNPSLFSKQMLPSLTI
jgi:heat shock protein beta